MAAFNAALSRWVATNATEDINALTDYAFTHASLPQ